MQLFPRWRSGRCSLSWRRRSGARSGTRGRLRMVSDRNRRTLIASALGALCVWLVAVALFALWRRPQFWVAPYDRFAQAQTLFERGEDAAAFQELDRAIAADPQTSGFHVFKGYRLLDRRD